MRQLWLMLGLTLALLVTASASAAPDSQGKDRASQDIPEYVSDRLLVHLRAPAGKQAADKAARLAQSVNGKLIASLTTLPLAAIQVPPDRLDYTQQLLKAAPDVVSVERDPIIRLHAPPAGWKPNDPLLIDQWALARLGVPDAWDVTRGIPSIIVAVLDTGVDLEHADMRGQLVSGWDYVRNGPSPQDDNGHGTHVAGIVAAAANNALGVSGVAPGARVMPIKVMSSSGVGSHFTIAQGIEQALRNDARIINLSLGGSAPSDTLRQAIDHAWASGALVIAAAGNDNRDTPNYPASWPNVIGVGATNVDGTRAPFSNFGQNVSVVAPGVSILSTLPGDRYEAWPGTSMATPLVSGVAALLWSRYPTLRNDQVRSLILTTTDRVGAGIYDLSGWNAEYGYGQVNAARAVGLNIETPTAQPNRPTATPTPCAVPGLLPDEQNVITRINHARIEAGLPPLSIDMRLVQAARGHSTDMATMNRITHTGSDGSSVQDRVSRVGYLFSETTQLIAGGEPDGRTLAEAWLSSPTHSAVLMSNWVDVGVGLATRPGTYFYFHWTITLATRQASAPRVTPVAHICPSTTQPLQTPTTTPTTTPTPTPPGPGLWTLDLKPGPNKVGWVRSDEPHSGYWGDDDTYAGSLAGRTFYGGVQFDLSTLPPDARIQRAQLTLTGQDAFNRRAGGLWSIRLLGPDADYGWESHGYSVMHGVSVIDTVGTVAAGEIGEGVKNVFAFTVGQVLELQRRRQTTGQISFRFDGPMHGDNLFSWDSGQGEGSTQPGPVLSIVYAVNGGPPPTLTPEPPQPTRTPTATPPPPTTTPAPTRDPNGAITLQIASRPADTGWTVANEVRGNHLGDDDIYVGVFDGARYLGAVQFDLSSLPPGARVNWATLFLLGRSNRYTTAAGDYQLVVLAPEADLAWPSLTFSRLRDSQAILSLPPHLTGRDLQADAPYFFQLNDQAREELERRAATTRRLSLRLEGPASGADNLFSWSSGADGIAPVLTINYTP